MRRVSSRTERWCKHSTPSARLSRSSLLWIRSASIIHFRHCVTWSEINTRTQKAFWPPVVVLEQKIRFVLLSTTLFSGHLVVEVGMQVLRSSLAPCGARRRQRVHTTGKRDRICRRRSSEMQGGQRVAATG